MSETIDPRIDRVTDLFEKWAAEENEHRLAGEFGIAEGLKVASEDLRAALDGPPRETEVVDLVAALRATVEAAKKRREARDQR